MAYFYEEPSRTLASTCWCRAILRRKRSYGCQPEDPLVKRRAGEEKCPLETISC